MKYMIHQALRGVAVAAVGASLVLAVGGCEDDPFCFSDCAEPSSSGTAQGGGGNTGTNAGGDLFTVGSTGGAGGGCVETGVAEDTCNEVDDDCDSDVDEDVDYDDIQTCGTCDNNCFTLLLNADPATITCTWDGTSGNPGTCAFTDCAQDYFDLDMDGLSCEYYCVYQSPTDDVCNNTDDDCDGLKDEDVDLCGDAQNCGVCGRSCEVVHGSGMCVDQGMMPCTAANTSCAIALCDDDDMDGNADWWDIDGLYSTGCEYPCSLTDGGAGLGVEVCGDGVDNDCDGDIDGADSNLSGDPQLGVTCYGDPDGLCSDPAHAGATICVGQQVVCAGGNVIGQGDVPDICDGIDNDCDGGVDTINGAPPVDAGAACGISNVFPCTIGSEQCVNGSLTCIGNIDPQPELCNGFDDDCDGQIDLAGGLPPTDAGGTCNVPPLPPMGVTTPCVGGTLACVGAQLVCQGSQGPTSSIDGCNDDSNCDGQLTGQPNLQTDVNNCGMCGNNCQAGAVNAIWTCQMGGCQFVACEPGWHDLDMNNTCEYGPCTQTGAEVCDNFDNNCNGQTDEGVTPPSPQAVCGVSPAATRPECTSLVGVTCTAGTWQCSFPMGVCNPNCPSAVEICDNLDNDCDGGLDENVSNKGLACASDDGMPPPGHGACRTTGTFICNGPSATICSAVPANCATLPQGCTEHCDEIDNDCDGLIDEDYTNKGSNVANFVRPEVTQVASQLWIMRHEASRPNAGANTAGTGNGYHCTGGSCSPGIPNAPLNTVLDQTLACSVPGVLPWFNVTPIEVEQTCDALGGFICDLSEWQTACEAALLCDWGYNPRGAACLTPSTSNKFCNLHAYDFDPGTPGIQDGLLPTASPNLANCWADWSNLFNNATPEVFDITGNLREISKNGSNVYPLMGGAFNTTAESGARCDFDFYVVDQSFKLLDTGFRCCFDSDPRL